MAYPHCCMKGRKEFQWVNKKLFQKHPGVHNFCQSFFLCKNVNNFHLVCQMLKKIVLRSLKTKGPRPVHLNTLRSSLCTKTLKTATKNMKLLFLCIMIPLDEQYIIQNNYEF
jgi:hypothetical protein